MSRRLLSDGQRWLVVTEREAHDLVQRNYIVPCSETCGSRDDGHMRAGDSVYHLIETWTVIRMLIGRTA